MKVGIEPTTFPDLFSFIYLLFFLLYKPLDCILCVQLYTLYR